MAQTPVGKVLCEVLELLVVSLECRVVLVTKQHGFLDLHGGRL